MTPVILTREWLLRYEEFINVQLNSILTDALGRALALEMEMEGHNDWSMKDATTLASMDAKRVAKVTYASDFISDGKTSTKIRATVETEYGFNVDLLLYWNGRIYDTVGILLYSSEWAKVAEGSNYKLEIACSRGTDEFGPPFTFWYLNDSKKVKGVYKVPTVPIDVGTTDLTLHIFNKGPGSDELMTYNGTNLTFSFELEKLLGHQVLMNGNVVIFDTHNFWYNGLIGGM